MIALEQFEKPDRFHNVFQLFAWLLYRKLESQEAAIARESNSDVTVAVRRACLTMLKVSATNMKDTNSMRLRIARFLSDRYAYRTQPSYGSELVVFGVIVLTAIWPILLLADAMALVVR